MRARKPEWWLENGNFAHHRWRQRGKDCAILSEFELDAPCAKTEPKSPMASPVRAREVIPCSDTTCNNSVISVLVWMLSLHVTCRRDSRWRKPSVRGNPATPNFLFYYMEDGVFWLRCHLVFSLAGGDSDAVLASLGWGLTSMYIIINHTAKNVQIISEVETSVLSKPPFLERWWFTSSVDGVWQRWHFAHFTQYIQHWRLRSDMIHCAIQ